MKLQKTTWGLLITAIFLCTAVYFYEIQLKEKQTEIQSKDNKLFEFSEEDIKHITIETQQETLTFQKTEDEKNYWKMTQPKQQTANDATISFLTNLLVTGESDRNFIIPPNQQQEYGLDKPLATIKVTLKDNSNHQIILGNSNFNDEHLYAKIDPNNENEPEIVISLVSKDFQYSIDREIEEWLTIDKPSQPPEKPEE